VVELDGLLVVEEEMLVGTELHMDLHLVVVRVVLLLVVVLVG